MNRENDRARVCIKRLCQRLEREPHGLRRERLPRRMLSSWVPRARPVDGVKMTYGRTIGKALDKFSVST